MWKMKPNVQRYVSVADFGVFQFSVRSKFLKRQSAELARKRQLNIPLVMFLLILLIHCNDFAVSKFCCFVKTLYKAKSFLQYFFAGDYQVNSLITSLSHLKISVRSRKIISFNSETPTRAEMVFEIFIKVLFVLSINPAKIKLQKIPKSFALTIICQTAIILRSRPPTILFQGNLRKSLFLQTKNYLNKT